ncbi:MAG: periplasmic heavy metal sensor [Acidobacteria bacterium]|nr:periplasmic heavy metal sensor [Acidobacteriota bacterium]MBI3663071.1 periplasmic heavy metal sensor [Acidobacteriota bacterium]
MKSKALLMLFVLFLPAQALAQAQTPAHAPATDVVYRMDDPQAPHPPVPPPPPDLGKWWKNSDIVRELQLTEAQINQIEQTFLEHRLKLIDLRAEVERQETRLQPLIEADQPDESKVSAQIDLVLAARGKLEKANAMMMLAIRRVLSVEQWKKLEAIKHERERMRHSPPPEPGRPMHPPGATPPPRPAEPGTL